MKHRSSPLFLRAFAETFDIHLLLALHSVPEIRNTAPLEAEEALQGGK